MAKIEPGKSRVVSVEFSAASEDVPEFTNGVRTKYRAFVVTFSEIPVVKTWYDISKAPRGQKFFLDELTLIRR